MARLPLDQAARLTELGKVTVTRAIKCRPLNAGQASHLMAQLSKVDRDGRPGFCGGASTVRPTPLDVRSVWLVIPSS